MTMIVQNVLRSHSGSVIITFRTSEIFAFKNVAHDNSIKTSFQIVISELHQQQAHRWQMMRKKSLYLTDKVPQKMPPFLEEDPLH